MNQIRKGGEISRHSTSREVQTSTGGIISGNMSFRNKCGLIIAIALAVVQGGHSQAFITNGLVAYYPFNGNANDESGNINHGIVNGATLATDRFGVANRAYYFAGDGSHILVQDSDSLNMTNSLTVSAWINPQPGGLGKPQIVNKHIFYLALNSTDLPFALFQIHRYPNSSYAEIGTALPGPNEWIFVAGTYDRQILKLYTNGLVANQISTSTPIDKAPIPMAIGKNPEDIDAFRGYIDDVRIYDRALSVSEIEQLFLYESRPSLGLSREITVSFTNLWPGRSYQLQTSPDLGLWTNFGSPFLATNSEMTYGHFFDTNDFPRRFFRLEIMR